jgi:hypothetical protein
VTDDEIKALICDLFLGGDTEFLLSDDLDLLEAGICDSLGLVQLAGELQAHTPGLSILDQEVDRTNLGSIGAIRRFIAGKGIAQA